MHDLSYFREHLDLFADMAANRGAALDLDAGEVGDHAAVIEALTAGGIDRHHTRHLMANCFSRSIGTGSGVGMIL